MAKSVCYCTIGLSLSGPLSPLSWFSSGVEMARFAAKWLDDVSGYLLAHITIVVALSKLALKGSPSQMFPPLVFPVLEHPARGKQKNRKLLGEFLVPERGQLDYGVASGLEGLQLIGGWLILKGAMKAYLQLFLRSLPHRKALSASWSLLLPWPFLVRLRQRPWRSQRLWGFGIRPSGLVKFLRCSES